MNNNIINTYADEMINRINDCVKEKIKLTNTLAGAIISNVNEDGTVDVYLPPDNNKKFTRISNQTPFELNVGDSVELMLKDGSFNNCWVTAKHGCSYKIYNPKETYDKEEIDYMVGRTVRRIAWFGGDDASFNFIMEPYHVYLVIQEHPLQNSGVWIFKQYSDETVNKRTILSENNNTTFALDTNNNYILKISCSGTSRIVFYDMGVWNVG